MNKSKISLADILAFLAACVFSFVCFMGVNFLNIGSDKVWGMSHTMGCVVIAILIGLLLFGTAYGAKLLKRTNHDFKMCFVVEIILLTLFVLVAVFFATKISPFTHYFTVKAQKSEINSKLQTSITQAENMFAKYESYADNRENLYKNKLNTVVNSKRINLNEYRAYGFINNSIPDKQQIETKMFTVHADLFPTNYSDTIASNGIKEVATGWLQKSIRITNSWKPIGIVGVVNDIEKNTNEWLSTLVTLSQVREQGEQAGDFEYNLSFDDVKTSFTNIKNPTVLSLGFAVLAYVLMLLSWYVTPRGTRFPGFEYLFRFGKPKDNEL